MPEENLFYVSIAERDQGIILNDRDVYDAAIYKTLYGKQLEYITYTQKYVIVMYENKIYRVPHRLLDHKTYEANVLYYKIFSYLADRFDLELICMRMLKELKNIYEVARILSVAETMYLDVIQENLLRLMSKAEVSLFAIGQKLNILNVFSRNHYDLTHDEANDLICLYLRRLCIEYNLNIPFKFDGKGYQLGELEPVKKANIDLSWYKNLKAGDKIRIVRQLKHYQLWNDWMKDNLIGKIAVITSVSDLNLFIDVEKNAEKNIDSYMIKRLEAGPL